MAEDDRFKIDETKTQLQIYRGSELVATVSRKDKANAKFIVDACNNHTKLLNFIKEKGTAPIGYAYLERIED